LSTTTTTSSSSSSSDGTDGENGDGDGDGDRDGDASTPSESDPPVPQTDASAGAETETETDADTDKEDLSTAAVEKEDDLEMDLRPVEVVKELDRHIVGQTDAKKAVAIAMRNRWRRRQLSPELRKEVTPRNVLMIGPTGCGKTEVARRMALLSDAPFLKVEATKFTEVGYHGRDVDQIIRDIMDVSMTLTKKRKTEKLKQEARALVEDRILDLLTGPKEGNKGRDSFRSMLRDGLLDDQEVDVDVPEGGSDKNSNVFAIGDNSNPNVAAMSDFLSRMGSGQGKKISTERKRMPISEAKDVILELELERLLENVDLKKEAITSVEESGIVFIDEIDKICSSRDFMSRSADASAEGVQRDLLPLIEGTTINTKYGNVNTDYILFVASGAFHAVKPSDMLPELQGRLPIRVELNGLTEDDLYKILTEPVANVRSYIFTNTC